MDNNTYEKALTKLMEHMDNTAVFAQEQLPDIAAQMLAYGAFNATCWLVIAVGIALIGGIWLLLAEFDQSGWLGLIILLFALLLAGSSYMSLKKIELAPKLYIIDQLAKRVGK